jgi:hypothetical protein
MKTVLRTTQVVLLLTFCLPVLMAQAQPNPSGHWEGTVQAPDREINISVDLAKNEKGEWIGDLDAPIQNLKNVPLINITVKDNSVSFEIEGIPGKPVFEGKLSEDGKSVSGNVTVPAGVVPFQMKRTGEANVQLPPKSSPLTKEFEGTWEGTLSAGGQSFRLVTKFSKAADGTAQGTLDSLDQGASDLPLSGITIDGPSLRFDLRMVGGSYVGKLNKEATELAGEWTQGGNTLPLTFKRPAKPAPETKK